MRTLVFRAIALAALVFTLSTHAGAQVETCHKINALGIGSLTGPTTTESQIIGGGIIHGTTTAELVFTGFDPNTGIATFEGTLELTTRHGTLDLFIFNGVFNLVTGEFSSDSAVTGGTGRFEGATGGLFFHGFVLADGVTFIDDEISGEICLTLP